MATGDARGRTTIVARGGAQVLENARVAQPSKACKFCQAEHASIFFGRTAAIASVLMKLRRQAERPGVPEAVEESGRRV